MPREPAAMKAERYLVSGRLQIHAADAFSASATVRGDSGELYRVIHDHGLWQCSCPARTRCAHLLALARVWLAPESKGLP
ncbi:MAG: hypothetical protein ACR2I4_05325 [Actinomycetota bacterium]